MRYKALSGGKSITVKMPRPAVKRKPIVPSDEKIMEVFAFVEKHPKCNSADIMAETQFSMSTVERCIIELRKNGLVEHVGSRRHGGYIVVAPVQEIDDDEPVQMMFCFDIYDIFGEDTLSDIISFEITTIISFTKSLISIFINFN